MSAAVKVTIGRATFLAFFIAATASSQAPGPEETFVDNDFLGEQAVRATFAPDDFTIGFNVEVPFPGGTLQPVSLATNPVVGALTTGFGHAIYSLNPCGVIYPHVHPRGDENVFVLEGTIDTGFIDESGALIRNAELASKTAFVIPQGYMHYVANPTCEPAQALVTLPSSDGGIYGGLPAVLGLPPNILRAFTPSVSEEAITQLQAAVLAAGVIGVDPSCADRCAASGGEYGSTE